ncbi:hypothetical protein CDAR_386851 [Caerostris darwini]|uniref:Uncharacterized protein n=1 Tax=Caerostris darwini TaxID=1538125 RepID=A0AAV4PLX7_9ARAC|nr:hypothetical protein CDAR_386851 [Caerostris darwini]
METNISHETLNFFELPGYSRHHLTKSRDLRRVAWIKVKTTSPVLWLGVAMTRMYVTPSRGIRTSRAFAAFLEIRKKKAFRTLDGIP